MTPRLTEVFLTEAPSVQEKFRELLLYSFKDGKITNVQAQKLYLQAQKECGVPEYNRNKPGRHSDSLSSFAQHALASVGARHTVTPTKSNPKAVTWEFDPAKVQINKRMGRGPLSPPEQQPQLKADFERVAKRFAELQNDLNAARPRKDDELPDPWQWHDEKEAGAEEKHVEFKKLGAELAKLVKQLGMTTVLPILKKNGLEKMISRARGRRGQSSHGIETHRSSTKKIQFSQAASDALEGVRAGTTWPLRDELPQLNDDLHHKLMGYNIGWGKDNDRTLVLDAEDRRELVAYIKAFAQKNMPDHDAEGDQGYKDLMRALGG